MTNIPRGLSIPTTPPATVDKKNRYVDIPGTRFAEIINTDNFTPTQKLMAWHQRLQKGLFACDIDMTVGTKFEFAGSNQSYRTLAMIEQKAKDDRFKENTFWGTFQLAQVMDKLPDPIPYWVEASRWTRAGNMYFGILPLNEAAVNVLEKSWSKYLTNHVYYLSEYEYALVLYSLRPLVPGSEMTVLSSSTPPFGMFDWLEEVAQKIY